MRVVTRCGLSIFPLLSRNLSTSEVDSEGNVGIHCIVKRESIKYRGRYLIDPLVPGLGGPNYKSLPYSNHFF